MTLRVLFHRGAPRDAYPRIDETALAPSLLESIQVVTLERPRNTFPELAKDAILSHPGGKMTAAEIFKVVEKKYP